MSKSRKLETNVKNTQKKLICLETKLRNLAAAVKNIGIERLGEPNIRKMMLSLGVRDLSDIFKLTKTQILSMEGFQNQSAENLLREISNARTVPDWQLLASLNIKGIGPNIAKSILREYTLSELQEKTVEELSRIEGIGPERANALFRELRAQHTFSKMMLKISSMTSQYKNAKITNSTHLAAVLATSAAISLRFILP